MNVKTEPQRGDLAICSMCGEQIVYIDSYWDHNGENKPRHPAVPGEKPERHKVEMRLDLDAIERRIRRAHEKVSALCQGEERWTMRVPADESYDHDLIIGAALRDADKMLLALRALLHPDPNP